MNQRTNKERFQLITGLIAAAACAAPATAAAQTPEKWSVTGAAGGAAPLNGPYDAEYGTGVTGGAGVYRALVPALGVGLRVDAGGIVAEDGVSQSLGDGGLGFGALSPALRYRPLQQLGIEGPDGNRGLYLELAGGVGLLENEVEPVVAPAAGYIFDVGALGVGPTARYMQVITGEGDTLGGEDVRIMTVGVELVFLGEQRSARVATAPPPPAPSEATASERQNTAGAGSDVARDEVQRVAGTQADSDADGVLDEMDLCPGQSESLNAVNDHDGCPDTGRSEMIDNRMVIDERVFFDYDEAALRPEGKRYLDDIARMYQASGQDATLRVSGHADRRGPAGYNMQLSRERAESVRDYLVSQGIPASLIEIEAHGERRPAVPNADQPSEFQQNRRVQFEIIRPGHQPR